MRIKRFDSFVNEGDVSRDNTDSIGFKYNGDPKVRDLARDTVGDGKDPNHFFVTISDDYMYKDEDGELVAYSSDPFNAPKSLAPPLSVETQGPFATIEEAMEVVDSVDLDDNNLQHVTVEDRKIGVVYEKYLIAKQKLSFDEDVIDDRAMLK